MRSRPIIEPESLYNLYANGNKVGFKFQVHQNRYRNVPLSCIEKITLKVDGKEIPSNMIHFCLGYKKLLPHEVADDYTDYWAFQDTVTIEVDQLGGLEYGEHEIDLYMLGKSAYISRPFYVTDVVNQPHTYPTGNIGEKATLWVMA
ncbi:MAG: hypothetical protein IKE00_04100 [Oscillospiraceae bacterium]|nr:hypothetical protein [Oscillospiraceae bacterium]